MIYRYYFVYIGDFVRFFFGGTWGWSMNQRVFFSVFMCVGFFFYNRDIWIISEISIIDFLLIVSVKTLGTVVLNLDHL